MKTIKSISSAAILFLGLVFFMTSCTESFESLPEEPLPAFTKAPCNDYEYVGEFYQDALHYLLSFSAEFSAFEDIASRENYVINRIKKFYNIAGEQLPRSIANYDEMEVGISTLEILGSSPALSDYEKDMLSPVFVEVPNIVDQSQFNHHVQLIFNLECELSEDNNVENLANVMKVLSITKSSIQFWNALGISLGEGTDGQVLGNIALAGSGGAIFGLTEGPGGERGFAIFGSALAAMKNSNLFE